MTGAAIAAVLAAQSAGALCASMGHDAERLRCYDRIHRDRTGSVQATENWTVREDRSPVDDSPAVTMLVRSREPHVNRYGRGERLRLVIRCRENTTAAYIYFAGEFMASGARDGTALTWRVDDLPARTRTFYESNDNSSLGLWRGAQSIPAIRSWFGGSSLYVRATPFSENAVEARFDISGLEEAIAPLREACNW